MFIHIHQQTGSSHFPEIFNFIDKLYKDLESEYLLIVVDNQVDKVIKSSKFITLPADNKYREFSGWLAGIEYYKKNLSINKSRGLILTNDTLLRHRVFDGAQYRSIILGIEDVSNIVDPAYLGHIDEMPNFNKFKKYDGREYISTYFLYVNNAAIEFFHDIFDKNDIDELFMTDWPIIFDHKKFKYCSDYFNYIEKWVYLPNSGGKWYGHSNLSQSNYQKIKLKCISIVIEHNISLRASGLYGIRLIPLQKYLSRSMLQAFLYKIRMKIYNSKSVLFNLLGIKW